LISGILLSRTISGVIADLYGWRTIYAVASVLAAAVAVPPRATMPRLESRAHVPHPRLVRYVFKTVAEYRAVPVTLLICAANLAMFSLFWTALTYLLSAPPFVYGTSRIGGFGLEGLAGALAARRAGLLHDRGWSVTACGAALCLPACADADRGMVCEALRSA
jgi:MFS family permease